jgi:glyoxylase-like metal-dependent hydrolase (beta-lactamase superfamily II)
MSEDHAPASGPADAASSTFDTLRGSGAAVRVANGLAYLRDRIVNLYFASPGGAAAVEDRGWVLIDAGLPGSADRIAAAAATLFGPDARPSAIVLTHGHFDHVGSLKSLAERWDVPVYAHELELPYLTGRSAYPPPDPTVGGGGMARMAGLFPRGPIDLGARARTLPADGAVPGLAGWRWIHTPGHAPGHVSLFRDADRTLVAGDAFVTTKQESMTAVFAQRKEIHGPPAYFTPNWDEARDSVRRLAELRPELAATGHGLPMRGERLHEGLERLARDFDRLARPSHGRYVHAPATMDERGVVSVPPPVPDPLPKLVAAGAVVALAGWALSRARQPRV